MEFVIVSGDSFTDPNYKSETDPNYDTSFKKWYEYIEAETVINVGKIAFDNVSMINDAIKEIYSANKKIDRVIIALSNWHRFALPHEYINPDWAFNFSTPEREEEFRKNSYMQWLITSDYYKKNYELNVGYCREYDWNISQQREIDYAIEQTCFHIIKLSDICKSHGIKLHVFQMLSPIVYRLETTSNFINALHKNKWWQKLLINSNDDDLMNFPFFIPLDGYHVTTLFRNKNCRISKLDSHPNEKGHRIIGEWFNEYKKR